MEEEEAPGNTKRQNWVFSCNLIKRSVSFTAALRGHSVQKIHQEAATSANTSVPEPPETKQQETGQSVQASSVNSLWTIYSE
jgi:hypothetical protein